MTSGYSEVSDVLSVEAYFDKPFMAYFFVYQSDDSLSDNEKFSLYRIRGLLLIFSYRAISELLFCVVFVCGIVVLMEIKFWKELPFTYRFMKK